VKESLLCARNQFFKDGSNSQSAGLVSARPPSWDSVTRKRQVNRQFGKWVGNIVLALGFSTLLASGSESSVVPKVNCAFDKGTFPFNGNLALGEPSREITVLNFVSQGFEFTHTAGELCSAQSIVSIPSETVSNQQTNENTKKANQSSSEGTDHVLVVYVLVFTIGLIIGLIISLSQGRRRLP
jgi:hypothetical protein